MLAQVEKFHLLLGPTLTGFSGVHQKSHATTFQKNYPKNIFTPILGYLALLGLSQQSQLAVGSRQDIQQKNVVSLQLYFDLMSQPWFAKINIDSLIAFVSNRILLNSKIERKMFHLQVVHRLFGIERKCATTFKRGLSRCASQIQSEVLTEETHPMLFFRSATAYLIATALKIFIKSLSEGKTKAVIAKKIAKIFAPKAHSFGLKSEFKDLLKYFCLLLNSGDCSIDQLKQCSKQLAKYVTDSAEQMRSKYNLIQNVPCWKSFLQCVIEKCVEYRQNDKRVVAVTLKKWLQDFKQLRSLFSKPLDCDFTPLKPMQKVASIEVMFMQQMKIPSWSCQGLGTLFYPIILVAPSLDG